MTLWKADTLIRVSLVYEAGRSEPDSSATLLTFNLVPQAVDRTLRGHSGLRIRQGLEEKLTAAFDFRRDSTAAFFNGAAYLGDTPRSAACADAYMKQKRKANDTVVREILSGRVQ